MDQPKQIRDTLEKFDYRDSELVIGVVCAVGTDYRPVAKSIEHILARYSYSTQTIKVSELIENLTDQTLDNSSEISRISTRIDAGNHACQETGRHNIWALAVIAEISRRRHGLEPLPRTAHVILSLKRPAEVATLRKVYGDGFFLVGVFATEQERLDYLIEQNAPKIDAMNLIRRDADEARIDYGQHTRDTFQLSDVFVQFKGNAYEQELHRFFALVFSHPYFTPSKNEHGMFLAYASSLRSSQLGRQVGAAVLNADGDLLAVGCNDVPKPGGGLYWPGNNDQRDHVLGYDTNDRQKDQMVSQLASIMTEFDKAAMKTDEAEILNILKEYVPLEKVQVAASKIRTLQIQAAESRNVNVQPRFRSALDITEYGRAVHAEMDALMMCARSGVSPKGAVLYVTTFPCHNCTRHLIAAGIQRVYYIEPYAKSRAEELHEDAIVVEDRMRKRMKQSGWRVPFSPFVGIGPRRYFDLFSLSLSSGYELIRKKSGLTFPIEPDSGIVRTAMSPYSYLQREALAVEKLDIIPGQQLKQDLSSSEFKED
jgi:deoxycytidylate deaminase